MQTTPRIDAAPPLDPKTHDAFALARALASIHRSLEPTEIISRALAIIQQSSGTEFAATFFRPVPVGEWKFHSVGALPASVQNLFQSLPAFSSFANRAEYLAMLNARVQSLGFDSMAFSDGIIVTRAASDAAPFLRATGEQIEIALANARAFAALEQSEAWHRGFVESNLIGFLESDDRGIIRFANETAAQMLDTTRAQLIGQPFQNLMAELDVRRLRETLEELRQTGILTQRFAKMRTATGAIKHISFSARRLGAAQRQDVRYQAILWDETEQHQIRETLARQNQELERLAEFGAQLTTLDPAAIADLTVGWIKKILRADFASLRLMEGSRARLWSADLGSPHPQLEKEIELTETLRSIVSERQPFILRDVESDPHLSASARERIRRTGARAVCTVPLAGRDQVIGILSAGFRAPHPWSAREINLLQTIAHQAANAITNAQLFQKVSRVQNELQAILDSGFGGLYAVDRAGRFMLFNHSAEQMSGWLEPQVRGKTWEEIFGSAGAPLIRRAMQTGEPAREMRDRFLRTRAEVLPVGEAAAPLRDERGQIVGAAGAFWDLSREKQAEQTRAFFLRTVVHELGSALTKIILAADLANDPHLPEPRRAEMTASLKKSARGLKDLTDQFLEKEGEVGVPPPLQIESLALLPVLEKAVDAFRIHGDDRLRLRAPAAAAAARVRADRFRLEIILRNLIDNAIKYCPPPGQVQVSFRVLKPRVEIAVRDQGIGIAAAERAHVLKPFYRGRAPRRRNIRGHGLGLAIANEFAKEMGATLRIARNKGKGTTVLLSVRRVE